MIVIFFEASARFMVRLCYMRDSVCLLVYPLMYLTALLHSVMMNTKAVFIVCSTICYRYKFEYYWSISIPFVCVVM